jgi:hypothetical protein
LNPRTGYIGPETFDLCLKLTKDNQNEAITILATERNENLDSDGFRADPFAIRKPSFGSNCSCDI